MASIELRGKSYRVVFRFEGERYSRSLQTRSEKVALGALHRLEDNLRRVELGTLTISPDVDAADFLLSDGTKTGVEKPAPTRSPIRTLGKLCESYLASMPEGALESNTRNCIDIHIRHFEREFGRQLSLLEIDEASHHFVHTVKGTKWANLRGWHVFRHSFCSNCAASGVDQRIIDAWVGHQTEEMRRR